METKFGDALFGAKKSLMITSMVLLSKISHSGMNEIVEYFFNDRLY